MESMESKLHNYMWQLHFILFPDTTIDEPVHETISGQVDKKNEFVELSHISFLFGFFSTLTKMEKFRSSFRSKVNNINNFLAWTTYFSPRFHEEIEHFDPFLKSETSGMLDQLNCNIFREIKELHENDPLRYGEVFGIYHDHEENSLLFLFDMRKECPNFSVYVVRPYYFHSKKLLYCHFVRDRRNNFSSYSNCLPNALFDFSVH